MDELLDAYGRDAAIVVCVFFGTIIRAGKPEKIPVVDGFILSFTPFFVVCCLLYVFEWMLSSFGLVLPTKVIASCGGIFGYLGNSWLVGLAKNGQRIEEGGSIETLATLVKSIVNFFKKSD